MQVQPYLLFEGRCDEAIEFYKQALGAELIRIRRYRDHPDPHAGLSAPHVSPDHVLHATLRIGQTVIFASDGPYGERPGFQGFSLALDVATDAEAARLLAALSADGGQVRVPLAPTYFASSFGMVADRFGVSWMVVAGTKPA